MINTMNNLNIKNKYPTLQLKLPLKNATFLMLKKGEKFKGRDSLIRNSLLATNFKNVTRDIYITEANISYIFDLLFKNKISKLNIVYILTRQDNPQFPIFKKQ